MTKDFKFIPGEMAAKNFVHAAVDRLAQSFGGGADVLIAGFVAKRVVGQLEAIEVQTHNAQGARSAA